MATLENLTAVVTGASSGIGRATAALLAEAALALALRRSRSVIRMIKRRLIEDVARPERETSAADVGATPQLAVDDLAVLRTRFVKHR